MTDAEGERPAPHPPQPDAEAPADPAQGSAQSAQSAQSAPSAPSAEPAAEDAAAPARPLTRGLRSAPPSSRRVSDDQRFQLSTYVPPPPKVSYREPRTITPQERAERAERAR